MTVGTLPRPADDDYPVAVSFALVDVFAPPNAVTSATAVAAPVTVPPLAIGTPTVAMNVATFRVSGGVVGTTYTVAVTATNAASPPNVVCRSIEVPTEAC